LGSAAQLSYFVARYNAAKIIKHENSATIQGCKVPPTREAKFVQTEREGSEEM